MSLGKPAVAAAVLGAVLVGGLVAYGLTHGRDAAPSSVIVYVDPPETAVYSIRPDGSGRKRLAAGFMPTLSQNGKRLAYLAEDGWAIEIARIDGTPERKLRCGPGQIDRASWSPTGREIVCGSSWQTGPGESWHAELYVVDVASGGARRVVARGSTPDWSPDGRRIVYEAPRMTARQPAIAVIDLRTSRIRNLGSGYEPRWSPDGEQIAYSTLDTIGVMNADGSNRQTILRSTQSLGDPVWSPDGTRIAYTAVPTTAPRIARLYVMDSDGTHSRALVRGAGADWN